MYQKIYKFLLIFGILALPVFADDEILLQTKPIQHVNTVRDFEQTQTVDKNYKAKTPKANKVVFDESDVAQSKKSTKFKKEKQYKNVTVGVTQNTSFKSDKSENVGTMYSKYAVNERFSVDTSYTGKKSGDLNGKINSSFSIAPEMKINKKMSVQNVLSRNFSDKSNSEEVRLNIEPFKDDRMDLNIGAGQVQYDDGSPAHSRLNFGTQIRF